MTDGGNPAGPTFRAGPMETDFDGIFDACAALYPAAHRCLADSFWFDATASTLLPTLAAMFASAPSPLSHALLFPTEAVEQVGVHSAFGGVSVLCYALWRDAADDVENQRWFADVKAALATCAKGHYVGEAALLGSHGAERLRGSYYKDGWARLLDVRRRYDPDGLFAVDVPGLNPVVV